MYLRNAIGVGTGGGNLGPLASPGFPWLPLVEAPLEDKAPRAWLSQPAASRLLQGQGGLGQECRGEGCVRSVSPGCGPCRGVGE